MARRGLGVDLLALGDAPQERLDVEARRTLRGVGEPRRQALGQVLGELVGALPAEPLRSVTSVAIAARSARSRSRPVCSRIDVRKRS